uniref:Prominin 1a n=1 Tax=Scophthalmus maximus TaxID=52904 RepID=A0A8D3C0P4_SCOMX
MWSAGVLLLLPGLLLLLPASGELQQETETRRLPPPGKLDFGYVPAGLYETLAHYEPGPIGILFHMVHTFLHAVQPNAFPQDLIVKLAKDKFGALQTEYQKAIYYEIGFLVCAAVGLLFTVLLPLVGLFFCLCRCCDNCGGEMHQRQRKNADCRRGLLGTLLFSTSLVITIGVLCAYAANQNLSSQVKNIRRLVNSNMRDLHTFANDTPMQIDYLISQYATAKKKVIYDLNHIGPLLGGRIHDQLDKEVHPALDRVLNMAGAMRETKEALENVSVSLEVLQEGTGKLNFNLSLVRAGINRTLSDPGCHDEKSDATTAQLCRNIRQSLSQLHIGANFTRLPNVNAQLEKVNDVLRTDLGAVVQRVSFRSIDTVASHVQNLVDGIGQNISSFSKGIEDYYPEIDKMDFYRWIGCIGLCCVVVLVLAFNYLGLLCGTLGYDKHASPTTRGCISNTGGTMLMAGVGFSFIFSWVLMGLVTVLFLAGGNMEKLGCEPFRTRELFKASHEPGWKRLHRAEKTPETKCTVDFMKNIFIAIDVLNNTQLDSVKIDLRGIILLEAEGKQNLLDFSEAGLAEINYADYLEECFHVFIPKLCLCFVCLQPRGALQTALKGHSGTLRQIHSQQITPMEQAMVTALNQSMRFLERTASDLPVSKNQPPAKISIEAAQYLISRNATHLINQESGKYTATIVGYFHQYIEWVKTSLAMEVAPCKPFSNMVDTAEIIACSFLVDSMNTFWMGLGCSTLFLLPSIVLAVRLSKHYRRMDTEDVYDE